MPLAGVLIIKHIVDFCALVLNGTVTQITFYAALSSQLVLHKKLLYLKQSASV